MTLHSVDSDVLTGKTQAHLVAVASGTDSFFMEKEAARAWGALVLDAERAGFQPRVASAFRDYERQLVIWNGKADGTRPLVDAEGKALDRSTLDEAALAQAILQWSAIPGASRHHWGTDIDVFDAAAVTDDYVVELTPRESEEVFGAFHRWLDARASSFGFYRPYDRDRGGVKPERWHLSYGPVATQYFAAYTRDVFDAVLAEPRLRLGAVLRGRRDDLYDRYVLGIAEYRFS